MKFEAVGEKESSRILLHEIMPLAAVMDVFGYVK
jgi:hypothetical protein